MKNRQTDSLDGPDPKKARTEESKGARSGLTLPSSSERMDQRKAYDGSSPYKYAAIGGLISDDLVSRLYASI
jgi:hypothetical protein